MLVSEVCIRIRQDAIDYALNLSRINEIIIVRADCHILKHTAPEENNYRINRNIWVVQQFFAYCLNVSVVLHDGVVESMLLLAVI